LKDWADYNYDDSFAVPYDIDVVFKTFLMKVISVMSDNCAQASKVKTELVKKVRNILNDQTRIIYEFKCGKLNIQLLITCQP
jgi:hypothetical protein